MRITLRLHRWAEAPRANGGKSRFPALGWSDHAGQEGTIHVVRGFHLFFFALGRKVHEAEHILANLGNEMHAGHDAHLCGRSWHAIRLFPRHCVEADSVKVAKALRRDGDSIEA